jgi:hypothetical protein
MIRASAIIGPFLVLGALFACGDSTSPEGPKPSVIATYYDTFAGQLLARNTHGDSIKAQWVEILNGPIAYGRSPSRIAIADSDSTASWFANGALFVDSSMTSDSSLVISVWRDTLVSSFILAFAYNSFPNVTNASFAVDSGAIAYSDTVAVTVSTRGASGRCDTTVVIAHVSSIAPTWDPQKTTCMPATFTIGGHLHFEANPGIPSPFQDIDLTSTTISAVRLQAVHGAIF